MAQSKQVSNLRRIEITARPTTRFSLPKSNGYSVYGALLNALASADESTSERVHDSSLGSLHNSGLQGTFGRADKRHHQLVLPDKTYRLVLGVVDPEDTDIFNALVNAFVLDGETLTLTNGELRIDSFESTNTTHEALLSHAAELDDPLVEMSFNAPTCIEEADEVTTMFPHREPVFTSLAGKWNRTAPDELALSLPRETIRQHVYEKPDARSYATHSVLVNRVTNEDGETRNIFRQGFTGECGYGLKDAPESVSNAVVALARFGQFSGVGSAVARGCGNIGVEVN
ncbi:CRISPR-associated protein Cas6 [Haloferax sp. Atlit-19N]|uniref:CRISPR system precrRNA processing endoribonuclease RAMP protein Cas6 n=1 Tax=Haloferax sp. Atlit-19N TaxID=2077201 RepID=UPI000E21FA2D|nr:CRISPR system precrRNA processing endoribonuclease RAMP protein Cas6 [Haloferax sp. Atlit-19N]RDZ43721.1 CRISPR-associated protein Cas6 [Haloferax sp. Atlit-19N]